MSVHTLRRSQWLPRPLSQIFDFFKTPDNLAKLTPPWLGFQIQTPKPHVMKAGAIFDFSVRPLGIPQHWRTVIESYDPPHGFVDVQIQGPYKLWRHAHLFAKEDGGTRVSDEIRYELPYAPLDVIVLGLVESQLSSIFDYRKAALAALFPPIKTR